MLRSAIVIYITSQTRRSIQLHTDHRSCCVVLMPGGVPPRPTFCTSTAAMIPNESTNTQSSARQDREQDEAIDEREFELAPSLHRWADSIRLHQTKASSLVVTARRTLSQLQSSLHRQLPRCRSVNAMPRRPGHICSALLLKRMCDTSVAATPRILRKHHGQRVARHVPHPTAARQGDLEQDVETPPHYPQ